MLPPDEQGPPPREGLAPEPVPPGDPGAGSCPRCGSPYAPGQEYCLECGLRLPLVRGFVASNVIPALSTSWRRHVRWYPGDWIWPVVFGLVVAVAATTVAILVTNDDQNSTSRTIVATTDTGGTTTSTTPTETTGTETSPTGTTPTETTATETTPTTTEPPPPPPPPPPQRGPIKWPAGKAGFTVILASVFHSDGLASARTLAKKAIDAGLPDVGILNSSNYSSLKSGYYVVFSGVFDTLAEAEANLATAKTTVPQAYTRKIAP